MLLSVTWKHRQSTLSSSGTAELLTISIGVIDVNGIDCLPSSTVSPLTAPTHVQHAKPKSAPNCQACQEQMAGLQLQHGCTKAEMM